MSFNKTYVILLAGGYGTRFESAIPKQFVKMDGVPIIIYTLRKLQIDAISEITIVCVKKWIPYLEKLIDEFHIKKVSRIVPGGDTGFASTCNGFYALPDDVSEDDIIIIHDSVRPLIPAAVIEDAIDKATKYGNGCASLKSVEGLVLRDNPLCGVKPANRYRVMRVQTPQA